jgi:hypothetical protein
MSTRSATQLVLLVSALGVAFSRPAHACQCGTRPPVDIAFAQSEVVFAGVVTAIEPAPTYPEGFVQGFPVSSLVHFRVQKRWKGAAATELTLTAASTCAYSFQLGRAYLVFAGSHGPAGVLEASKCLPNKPYAQAAAELAFLGPPTARR